MPVMNSKPRHNRIIKIVSLALLINFSLANLTFAQTPSTAPEKKIDGADWRAAQVGLQSKPFNTTACLTTFWNLVQEVTNKEYKTGWYEVTQDFRDGTVGTGKAVCVVVPSYVNQTDTGADKGRVDWLKISEHYTTINNLLNSGGKITEKEWTEARKNDAAAQNDASVISAIFGWILDALLSTIAVLLGHLTVIAAKIFDAMAQNIISITEMPRVVNIGWAIVRDICNMFFILILIVIAMAAILRIESYDYRHLMGEVILMAILVNFSQVIAVTIMNFVNYIAAIFYGNGFGFSEMYVRIMSIAGAFDSAGTLWDQSVAGGWTGALTIGLGRIAFMVVGFVVFVALAALFLVRLIGLYVLIIFSPVAYVARILPATEKYSEEWWSHFFKYLIWAPIAMFMLRLTFMISDAGGLEGFEKQGNSSLAFFILTGFLAASVLVAKEAGMVGGEMIVHGIEGVAHKAVHAVSHSAKGYAGRKWNEMTGKLMHTEGGAKPSTLKQVAFAVLNPVAQIKGMMKRGEELAHHQSELVTAYGQQNIERLMTGTTLPHAQLVERRAENEKLKFLVDMKKEQWMAMLEDAKNIKGHEGETTRLALMKAGLSNGYFDDGLRNTSFAEEYGEVFEDPSTGEKWSMLSSPDTMHRFLRDYLGHGEQAMRFVAEDMEDFAKRTNHPEYIGHAKYSPEARAFVWGMKPTGKKVKNAKNGDIAELEQVSMADMAAGEWEKQTNNDLPKTAPHAQVAQFARIDKASGKIITSYVKDKDGNDVPVTGGKEIEAITWGPSNMTQASKDFFYPIRKQVSAEAVIDRYQNLPLRIADKVLAAEMIPVEKDTDEYGGTIVVKNSMELRKIKESWDNFNDGTRALYARKLNISVKERKNLTNMRIKYEGEDVEIDGVKYTGGDTQWIDKSQTARNPVIKHLVKQAKGIQESEEAAAANPPRTPRPANPQTPPAAPFLTDARGNPVDRDGNPIRV